MSKGARGLEDIKLIYEDTWLMKIPNNMEIPVIIEDTRYYGDTHD